MRFATLRVSPLEAAYSGADRELANAEGITRRSIRQFDLREDGTVVVLKSLRGDRELIDDIYESRPEVLAHEVSEDRDVVHVYAHFSGTDTAEEVLRLARDEGILVETPMEYTEDGSLRLTVVGESSGISAFVTRVRDWVAVSVDGVGTYGAESARLRSSLTPTQRQLLDLAVERGYFDVPRQVTAAELGEELGVSASAVSDRLRRVESNVLPQLVQ